MKKHISFGLSLLLLLTAVLQLSLPAKAASISLSEDEQWIIGLSTDYEYITEYTYEKYNCEEAGNKYWTSLSASINYRPDGTPYQVVYSDGLVEGNKLQVASAWYGQNVYFRERGTSGTGILCNANGDSAVSAFCVKNQACFFLSGDCSRQAVYIL